MAKNRDDCRIGCLLQFLGLTLLPTICVLCICYLRHWHTHLLFFAGVFTGSLLIIVTQFGAGAKSCIAELPGILPVLGTPTLLLAGLAMLSDDPRGYLILPGAALVTSIAVAGVWLCQRRLAALRDPGVSVPFPKWPVIAFLASVGLYEIITVAVYPRVEEYHVTGTGYVHYVSGPGANPAQEYGALMVITTIAAVALVASAYWGFVFNHGE